MKVPEPRKLKSGTWFIQLRLSGQSISVTARSKTECKHKAALIKSEHKAEKRTVSKADGSITLRSAIDGYITAKKNNLSPSTIRGYRIIQKNRFQDYMDKPIKSIKNWQAVYDSEANRLSPKTLHNSFGLLRSVYKYQMHQDVPAVSEKPVAKKERPFLDADQIDTFVQAVQGKPCEIPSLLALSSLRCSELQGLTWDKVDLEHDRIAVHGAIVRDENYKMVRKDTNKTNASWRYVPIFIPQLHDALNAVQDKHGPVVAYKTESGMIRAINSVCKEAGLPLVGLHGLRHSFASLCVHLGIPEETAMKVGGWSDFTTMHKIYTHISQKDMASQTKNLQDFFKNANKNAN